jgi:hypothetical protein
MTRRQKDPLRPLPDQERHELERPSRAQAEPAAGDGGGGGRFVPCSTMPFLSHLMRIPYYHFRTALTAPTSRPTMN